METVVPQCLLKYNFSAYFNLYKINICMKIPVVIYILLGDSLVCSVICLELEIVKNTWPVAITILRERRRKLS